MADTPNQLIKGRDPIKSPSTIQDSANQPVPELTFERSPSPEPPTLPATTYKSPSNPKPAGHTRKRSLSLELPKGPEITITRAPSPGRLEHGVFVRATSPETKRESSHENVFRKHT